MRMRKRDFAVDDYRNMNRYTKLITTLEMFRLGIRISAIAIILMGATAAAEDKPASGERLLVTVPEGWEKGFHDREGMLARADYLPVGQDQDEAKEMLSAQIMFGLTGTKPEQILGRLADEAQKRCQIFDAQPMQMGEDVAYDSLGIMVLCGKNSGSGTGELILVRAIAGNDNFYLVQKIWKTLTYELSSDIPVSFDERKKWLDYLASIKVCDLKKNTCPESAQE